jgi:hypothetical protein
LIGSLFFFYKWVIFILGFLNSKCTQRKQGVQNICYFRNTRCFILCLKSKVYEVYFVKEINTFLNLFSILKNIFKQSVDWNLSDKNCIYVYSSGMNIILFFISLHSMKLHFCTLWYILLMRSKCTRDRWSCPARCTPRPLFVPWTGCANAHSFLGCSSNTPQTIGWRSTRSIDICTGLSSRSLTCTYTFCSYKQSAEQSFVLDLHYKY